MEGSFSMRVWMSAIFSLALLTLGVAQSKGLGQWVVSGQDAYFVLSPTPLGTGRVEAMEWSSDGKFLLVMRTQVSLDLAAVQAAGRNSSPLSPSSPIRATAVTTISVWNAETQKLTDIYKNSTGNVLTREVHWILGTDIAVGMVTEQNEQQQRTLLLRFSKGSAALSPFPSGDSPPMSLSLSISPRTSSGVILGYPLQAGSDGPPERAGGLVWGIDSDGRLTGPFQMPEGSVGSWVDFRDDPRHVYFPRVERTESKPRISWSSFDLATGAIDVIPEPPKAGEPREANLVLALDPDPESMHMKFQGSGIEAGAPPPASSRPLFSGVDKGPALRLLVSKTDKDSPRALVAYDSPQAVLSPTNNAVAYVTDDVLLIRRIIKLPKSVFEQAEAAAKRAEALSKAKQVGTALLIYATDYDDKLPTDRNLVGIIDPYIKNSDLLVGFNYTFKGGDISKVESPAETELGYVNGPGGRAVVYVDGHAKWVPNK